MFKMVKKIEKLKSTKRFGARYGPRNKIKLDKIEEIQRSYQKCPYCTYQKVKRIAVGIWKCYKCDSKFTGRAYVIKGEKREEQIEESS